MKTLVIHPKDKSTDFLKPIYHGRGFTVITGGCTKEDVAKAIDAHDHIIMLGHGTPQGLLAMGQFNGKPKATPKPSQQVRAYAGGKPVADKDIKAVYTPSQLTADERSLLDQLPDWDDDDDDWFASRQVGSYTPAKSYSTYSSLATGYVIDDKNADQLRTKKVTAIWCNADQYMEWNNIGGFYTGMFISEVGEATMIGTAEKEKWMVEESNYAFASIMRQLITHPAEQVLAHAKKYYGKLAGRNAIARYNYRRLYERKVEEKVTHVQATA